jgi:hypothetical protein
MSKHEREYPGGQQWLQHHPDDAKGRLPVAKRYVARAKAQ